MKRDKNFNPRRKWTLDEKEEMEIKKIQLYYEQDGICAACGTLIVNNIYDVAHVIPKYNYCVVNYGWDVLNHKKNLRATHRGECNDKVMINPAANPIKAGMLAVEIQEEIDAEIN